MMNKTGKTKVNKVKYFLRNEVAARFMMVGLGILIAVFGFISPKYVVDRLDL